VRIVIRCTATALFHAVISTREIACIRHSFTLPDVNGSHIYFPTLEKNENPPIRRKEALSTTGETTSMKTNFVLFAMLLGLLVIGCSNNRTDTNIIDEDQLRSLVSAKILTYGIPGVQVCIKDQATGKTIKLSLGYSNLEARVPLRDTSQNQDRQHYQELHGTRHPQTCPGRPA